MLFFQSNRQASDPFIRGVSKPVISPPPLMSLSPFENLTTSPSNEPQLSLSSSFPTPVGNLSPLSPPISMTSTRSRTSPSNPPNIHGASGSKMSDPNMFKPGPNVQPVSSRCLIYNCWFFVFNLLECLQNLSDDTYCGKLHEFTVRHSLQTPVFKTFTKFCPKTHKTTYMCKVKVRTKNIFWKNSFKNIYIRKYWILSHWKKKITDRFINRNHLVSFRKPVNRRSTRIHSSISLRRVTKAIRKPRYGKVTCNRGWKWNHQTCSWCKLEGILNLLLWWSQ